MTRENPSASRTRAVVQRYGLAVLSVAVALGAGNVMYYYFQVKNGQVAVLLMAIAVTVWFAGKWPGVLAVVLSILGFDYFFLPPLFKFYFTRADIPYDVALILFACLISWFSSVRQRIEVNLRLSRDELQREVAIRTQQASLLDLTHDSIVVRDMSGVITYWNRGAEELYGWSTEQAIGKRAQDLMQTVFPRRFEEIQEELFRTDRWEGEVEKKRIDGTRVLVASRWSLQRNEDRNPVAILETENDITERKRREDEIRGLNLQLERRSVELEAMNKELEAFAYSISHDLRGPLRHIVGYTELLQKNALFLLDEKGRHYMMIILDSAKRMGMLIDDLLAFSRIGRAETRETMISLDHIVREVQNEVWQDTEGRSVIWKIGTLTDVYGDRSMLKLALVNLVSNAVKFTRKNPRPEIEIGLTDGRADGVTVYVKDNGVGFDMKYVNKLFGVFQRLHRADEFEGTGIGLATVQRIIHRHGGQVWAEGQVGTGATFYFSLPKP